MKNWKRIVEPFSRPFFFAYSRSLRGKTLGVRGLVTDDQGRVLLVEHSYVEGWWLPGGGVDNKELTQDAVVRELQEEAGINALEAPKLVSIHSNEKFFPGDHVLLFRIDKWEKIEATQHGEIIGVEFFALDNLPKNINRGTLARINEVFHGAPLDPNW